MKEAITLKDFLDYKYISKTTYSPDGKHAVYLVSTCDEKHNEYQSYLYIWDGVNHRQLTGTGKESMFFWEDDTTIIFKNVRNKDDIQKIQDGEELSIFYRISIHGGEAREAFRIPLNVTTIKQIEKDQYAFTAAYDLLYSYMYALDDEQKANIIKERKEMEDYEVLDEVPFYENGGGYTNKSRNSLFFYGTKEKTIHRISEELLDVYGFEVKGTNDIYYFGESFSKKKEYKEMLYRYDRKKDQTTTLLKEQVYSIASIAVWEEDVLVIASENQHYGINENPNFYLWKEAEKSLTLFAKNEEGLGTSVGSDARYGGGSFKGVYKDTFYYVTTRNQNAHVYALDKKGTSKPILEISGSVDEISVHEQGILYVAMEANALQELYTCSLDGKHIQQISAYNEDVIKHKDIRIAEACNLEQGGMTLYGWVLKPRDYDETKSYPAILDIHGGPKTVYGEVYYHEMQVWANMGYFVFFMNPRGGDGRGNEFADIRGKYGTIDYDDIMKFTDKVVESYPAIDVKRIGVTGGSYGGFMTNWIIGHTNRFACAASQRSIANWVSFAFTSDINEFFANDQQAAGTYDNIEKMWWHSPLKYANQCTTPTLFIHSNEDFRCPYSEGLQMYSALMANDVEARLVMFKGENHELSRSGKPKHRVKRLEEITNWMEQHLK